jgi:hypothetical protein
VSSAICANCHQTLNHIAPLFAFYDPNGAFKTTIQVLVPLPMNPVAQMQDWLPMTETTAWRYQKPAADIPALGAQMAADPDSAGCAVTRFWGFAMSKLDPVDALAQIPISVIQPEVDAFTKNNFKVRDLLFSIFTADAFIRF